MATIDAIDPVRRNEIARKIARVHGLRDPLGAKGFRVTRPRIERESRARRCISVVSFICLTAFFGLVVMTGKSTQDTPVALLATANRRSAVSGLAPVESPKPHLRTRAT